MSEELKVHGCIKRLNQNVQQMNFLYIHILLCFYFFSLKLLLSLLFLDLVIMQQLMIWTTFDEVGMEEVKIWFLNGAGEVDLEIDTSMNQTPVTNVCKKSNV